MTFARRVRPLRSKLTGLLLATLSTLLSGAATTQLDDSQSRLHEMTPAQRDQIASILKRFDLRIGSEEQKSIREIDRRLGSLPPEERARYLDVMRRYHNWLSSLPGTARDEILAKSPAQRMALVRSLAAKYPPASPKTPSWIEVVDLSGPSAFEIASLFLVWRKLSPDQRKEIEQAPVPLRTQRMHGMGRRSFQIHREIHPDDFVAEEWESRAETKLAELRVQVPELKGIPPAPDAASEPSARKAQIREQLRPLLLRRFAANLYALESSQTPVRPDRLAGFLAELPPWIRASFDTASEDEARRKLTLAYRSVFPAPNEWKPELSGTSKPKSATVPANPNAEAPASPSVPKPPTPPPTIKPAPSSTPF